MMLRAVLLALVASVASLGVSVSAFSMGGAGLMGGGQQQQQQLRAITSMSAFTGEGIMRVGQDVQGAPAHGLVMIVSEWHGLAGHFGGSCVWRGGRARGGRWPRRARAIAALVVGDAIRFNFRSTEALRRTLGRNDISNELRTTHSLRCPPAHGCSVPRPHLRFIDLCSLWP
jgi:hypothetical protein